MEENKAAFVDALAYTLRNYTRLGVGTLSYIREKHPGGREFVKIHYKNGTIKMIDVTADSCLAIMHDIYKALN